MEISWLGLLFLIIAWACAGVATGFGFYLHTKNKDYSMPADDRGYLLTTSITAACALAFTTVVTLMIIFMGRNQFNAHATTINRLMSEKLDLENQLNDAQTMGGKVLDNGEDMSMRRNILENPIPVRRGRSARPLII